MSLDEIVNRINNVTKEDLSSLARELIQPGSIILSVVGPFEQDYFDYFLDKQ